MFKLTQNFLVRTSKFNSFSKFFSSTKDYYAILGVKRGANETEIKEAYRNLAKKYHPDVNTSGVFHEPDGEKFKEVAEAYAVLSVSQSKLSYDLLNQEAPESIYREQREENYKNMTQRGPDGHIYKKPFSKGSYAEEKQKILEEERKRFNVDAYGRYKGGVPQKDGGFRRGKSLGSIGLTHEPLVHNMKINREPDSQFVTAEDANAYKNYKNEDKFMISKRWYWFKTEVDYEYLKLNAYRTGYKWFRNLFILLAGLGISAEIHLRRRNRKLLSKTKEIIAAVGKKNVYEVNGQKVRLSNNGVLKLE